MFKTTLTLSNPTFYKLVNALENLINMTDNVHEAIRTYSINAIYNQQNYFLPFICQRVFYEY